MLEILLREVEVVFDDDPKVLVFFEWDVLLDVFDDDGRLCHALTCDLDEMSGDKFA